MVMTHGQFQWWNHLRLTNNKAIANPTVERPARKAALAAHFHVRLLVTITARHFAAAQYTVMAVFFAATWYTLLTPWEGAIGQLEFMFAPGYENRVFFVWLAITNLLTVVVALTFWSKRAESYPLAFLLVCASLGLFAWALWSSDATFIFSYSFGCILSIWSWWQLNKSFKWDALKRAP